MPNHPAPAPPSPAAAQSDEAPRAGLPGEGTGRVGVHTPRAPIKAAKRGTGPRSTPEPELAAAASLARPDPVAEAIRRTRGTLGPSHALEY